MSKTYRANKLPADLGGCGWYEILAAGREWEKLSGDITADWVVIGAGFAGLTAAMRLGERCAGDKIVVLDAQKIGWGSAGRNSGFMIDLPHDLSSESYAGNLAADRKQIRMNRAAILYATDIADRLNLHAHFAASGKYHGAVDQRGMHTLRQYQKHLAALDEPCTPLDRAQMRELTGSDFYAGAIHAPGAAVIQPAGYIRGLADGVAARVGTDIYAESPVLEIVSGEHGGVHKIKTPHGTVTAPRIILTTNGHAESFGFHRKKFMHIFTFAAMTRALTAAEQKQLGGQNAWGLVPVDPVGATVRRYHDRIVIRHTFTYNPSLTTSRAQIARIGKRHDRAFAKRFPMLRGVEMQYRWGGALCLSRNAAPAFGEVAERIYAAVCHNGLGVAKGTFGGMAIADFASGAENQTVTDALSCASPAKLPSSLIMTVAARTVLWWKHQRAAAEL